MKKTCLLLLSLVCSVMVKAQTHIETVDYQKQSREALVNEMGYDDKTVWNAIEQSIEKTGIKGKINKGFTVYKGVNLPELGGGTYDLYFAVDRKSKKGKIIFYHYPADLKGGG